MKSNSALPWPGLVLLLFTAALAGCQSEQFSYYVSPWVTGRVLAADTRQPLGRTTVRRVTPMPSAGADTPSKGGQLQMETGGVRTDAAGRFVLEGERVIAVFRHRSWQAVTVSFAHAGYQGFQTNCLPANFAAQPAGDAPWINVGDVLLEPAAQ